MEENVVTNVVETVEVPEVVEEAVTAIQPIEIPQIEVPVVAEEKTFLGLDGRTWKDVGISAGLVLSGVAADRIIPWGCRKVKSGIKSLVNILKTAKNGVNLTNQQANAEQNQNAQEIPVPQQTESNPAPQEK